jgi:hypothetical protein
MNETFLGMITDIKCKNDNEETIIHYVKIQLNLIKTIILKILIVLRIF